MATMRATLRATTTTMRATMRHTIRQKHHHPAFPTNHRKISSSVDADEIRRFARSSAAWWDPRGEYGLLHQMNPVRVRYIRSALVGMQESPKDPKNPLESLESLESPKETNKDISWTPGPLDSPLAGLRILDMGCGGGLLSESLARLGATVVGADATASNIDIAQTHAASNPSLARGPGSVEYRPTTAEHLAEQGEQFDVVCALEIIEHVNDPRAFVHTCKQLTKPGGYIFMSTINRTPASYLFTILMAEHVLRWVPPGTHTYTKYVAPEELEMDLKSAGCQTLDISGMVYNPITQTWFLSQACGDGSGQQVGTPPSSSASGVAACVANTLSSIASILPVRLDTQMNYIMTARRII